MLLTVWGADAESLVHSARWPAIRRVVLGDLRLLSVTMPALRDDEASGGGPRLNVPVSIARSRSDRAVSADSMRNWASEFAVSSLDVVDLAGAHFFPLQPTEVTGMQTLVAHMVDTLQRRLGARGQESLVDDAASSSAANGSDGIRIAAVESDRDDDDDDDLDDDLPAPEDLPPLV